MCNASSLHLSECCILYLRSQLHIFNPLGPMSDQHKFSPKNISRSSRVKLMRITKLIIKGRML